MHLRDWNVCPFGRLSKFVATASNFVATAVALECVEEEA